MRRQLHMLLSIGWSFAISGTTSSTPMRSNRKVRKPTPAKASFRRPRRSSETMTYDAAETSTDTPMEREMMKMQRDQRVRRNMNYTDSEDYACELCDGGEYQGDLGAPEVWGRKQSRN